MPRKARPLVVALIAWFTIRCIAFSSDDGFSGITFSNRAAQCIGVQIAGGICCGTDWRTAFSQQTAVQVNIIRALVATLVIIGDQFAFEAVNRITDFVVTDSNDFDAPSVAIVLIAFDSIDALQAVGFIKHIALCAIAAHIALCIKVNGAGNAGIRQSQLAQALAGGVVLVKIGAIAKAIAADVVGKRNAPVAYAAAFW